MVRGREAELASEQPARGLQGAERPQRHDPLQRPEAAPPVVGGIGALPERPPQAERLLQQPCLELVSVGLGEGADLGAFAPVAVAQDVVVGQVTGGVLGDVELLSPPLVEMSEPEYL